ncbi:MAG: DUF5711 family protein [Oscillibacter sp.]|nr:DUF5711 family protein [Oscillibacter sp.]
MTDDYTNDELDELEEEQPKKHRLWHFLIFLLILIVVLGAVVLAAYRDGTGFDALRRFFSYGSVEGSGSSDTITYDASGDNRFAVLGEKLAVCSGTELQVLGGGETVFTQNVKMESPALITGGGSAAAWDVGGTTMTVFDDSGIKYSLSADEQEPFISATMNAQGWLAVTAEKKNYKGCVNVYSDTYTGTGDPMFTFNSSQRFVTDAYVTDDCKTLVAVTLGQENGAFVTNLVYYDLTAVDPKASCTIPGGLVLSLGEVGGTLTALSDTSLSFCTAGGEVSASYDYAGGYLREYDLGGDGYAALLLNRYQSGSAGRLITVGTDGAEIASLDVNEEILGMSAAGRYLAVLYADRLVVYNENLEEYSTLSGTDYARGVLMRVDGSALLRSSSKATLFLP